MMKKVSCELFVPRSVGKKPCSSCVEWMRCLSNQKPPVPEHEILGGQVKHILSLNGTHFGGNQRSSKCMGDFLEGFPFQ